MPNALLQSAGVQVNLFQHTLSHGTPDAVFPNNWFSTHPSSETGGQSAMVLYPMKTKNRQVTVSLLLCTSPFTTDPGNTQASYMNGLVTAIAVSLHAIPRHPCFSCIHMTRFWHM